MFSRLDKLPLLHANAGPKTLAFFRMWIFGWWAIFLSAEPLQRLALLDPEMLLDFGVIAWVPDSFWPVFFTPAFLGAFKTFLILLLVLSTLGIRGFRIVAGTAVFFLALYLGVVRGFGGHVYHQELVFLYAAFILALFPCADAWSLAARGGKAGGTPSAQYALPCVAICLMITFSYDVIGVARLVADGIDIYLYDTMARLVVRHVYKDNFWSWTLGEGVLTYPWMALFLKVAFPISTVLEIASPLVMFFRRWRLIWVVLMLGFHLNIFVFMNIFFVQNIVLLPLFLHFLFSPEWWKRWVPAVRTRYLEA